MTPDVIKELNADEPTKFHAAMLSHVKALVKISRDMMSRSYTDWDSFDDVYRGVRYPDAADKKAREKGEPEKMVVPLAYAQVQTFVAFCILLFTQNEDIVELVPMSPEDEQPAKLGEALIARDLRVNNYVGKLKQFLTDIARFSVGVLKHTWSKETEVVNATGIVQGTTGVPQTGKMTKTKFLGNRIENISPYRFFPDVRVPLSRFQEGEFCASEDEQTMISLKRLQKDGAVAGIKNIPEWSATELSDRMTNSRLFSADLPGNATSAGQSKGTCVVTEVQVWIVPNEFELEDGKKLGPEDYPVLYVITYANDQTIIRCEPMNYVHNQFTYHVAEFNPDMHHLINNSLSDMIDMLQSTISWFINAHISSVRRVIQNRLIIDPSGIEMEDLLKDRPYIRLNMAGASGDVRRYVQQLNVSDVTGAHVQDAEMLHQMMMTVTGISENALGQYATGRRSATEARNVNFNGSSRLKIIAQQIYYSALEPLFRCMLSNHRDGLDEETYVQVQGTAANAQEYAGFKVDRTKLVGDYDFSIFDATLPSEKGYLAQQIGDMLQAMMSNPQAITMFGYDPKKLFDKMFELRGVKNMENLQLTPETINQLNQQNAINNQSAGVPQEPGAGQAGAMGAAAGAQPTVAGVPMFAGQ